MISGPYSSPLPGQESYIETRRAFRWHIPDQFNAATDSLDRQCRPGADPDRTALITTLEDGKTTHFSYGELKRLSDLMTGAFINLMVEPGSTVATFLPQGLEIAITALATLKAGGVIAPMDVDWAPATLLKALKTAAPRIIIANRASITRARLVAEACSPKPTLICVNSPIPEIVDFWSTLYSAPKKEVRVESKASDPAFIVFSKGRTETPKAIVHAHRSILGSLPALQMALEGIPRAGDMLWSSLAPHEPNGLFSTLFAPWIFGVPVLAMGSPKTLSEAEHCFSKISEFGVRLLLLSPNTLNVLRLYPDPKDQFSFSIRAVASLGGRQPEGSADWCRNSLGVPLEKLYGEAETGLIASTHTRWFSNQGDVHLGRAAPGANINIVDDNGLSVPMQGIGRLAIPQNHPGVCLYTKGPHRDTGQWARRKYVGKWFLADDIASLDEDNTLTFLGKSDDILPHKNSGFLPDDVEIALSKHHMVHDVAVLNKAPANHEADIVAVISPVETFAMRDAAAESMLAKDIISSVKTSLAPYAIPRQIVFLKTIPKTDEGRAHRAAIRDAIRHTPLISV